MTYEAWKRKIRLSITVEPILSNEGEVIRSIFEVKFWLAGAYHTDELYKVHRFHQFEEKNLDKWLNEWFEENTNYRKSTIMAWVPLPLPVHTPLELEYIGRSDVERAAKY